MDEQARKRLNGDRRLDRLGKPGHNRQGTPPPSIWHFGHLSQRERAAASIGIFLPQLGSDGDGGKAAPSEICQLASERVDAILTSVNLSAAAPLSILSISSLDPCLTLVERRILLSTTRVDNGEALCFRNKWFELFPANCLSSQRFSIFFRADVRVCARGLLIVLTVRPRLPKIRPPQRAISQARRLR